MRKLILGLGIFFSLMSSGFAQELSYGLKGGVNYSMGGEIQGEKSGIKPDGSPNHWDGNVEGSGSLGFHGGAFAQVNFGKFFLRPEIVYTSLEHEFDFPSAATPTHTPKKAGIYSVQKFDIPFLVGYNIWGPLDIYAGPVYSNILDSSFTGNELEDPIVAQNTPINAQAGAKVEFGRFGIDLRYERSMSTAERQEIDLVNSEYGVNRAYLEDSRLNQFIVSVIFKIGGPGLNQKRRRACY